jgi:hypothetical protein
MTPNKVQYKSGKQRKQTNDYEQTHDANLDDWLTVHCSIILVDLQLDAQNSYLFIYI